MKLLSTAAVWSFAGLFIIANWIHAQSPLGLGDRNSSTPSQISAAKSEASSEHSFCYDDASLCQADSGPASQTAPPRPTARGVGIGKVGIGVSASTLGIGPQVAVSIAPAEPARRRELPHLRAQLYSRRHPLQCPLSISAMAMCFSIGSRFMAVFT